MCSRRESCQKYINDYIRLGSFRVPLLPFAFATRRRVVESGAVEKGQKTKDLGNERERDNEIGEQSQSPKKQKLVTVVMAVKVKECVKVVW